MPERSLFIGAQFVSNAMAEEVESLRDDDLGQSDNDEGEEQEGNDEDIEGHEEDDNSLV